MGWNCKRSLFKNHSKCSSPGHGAQYGGYITRHWNWMNSYWIFWIGGFSWRFSVSSFCDFWKITFLQFHRILHLFGTNNPLNFSDMLHKENYSLSVHLKWLILIEWILVSVALKKWLVSFDAQCTFSGRMLHALVNPNQALTQSLTKGY